MNKNKVHGLRVFLITLIDLISQGKTESCIQVEAALLSGIATKLYSSYTSNFTGNGFNEDNIPEVDEYFKQQWAGVADGQELRKYGCKNSDGIALIVKLALNEIF